jgi:hypothetical protein
MEDKLKKLEPIKLSNNQTPPQRVNNPTRDIVTEMKRIAKMDIYGGINEPINL